MNKTTAKMNLMVADMSVLYVKLHNYHWNVKGMEFHPVHAFTEKLYDEVTEIYDALAERMLQLGAKPVVTLAQALKLTRIKEEEATDFNGKTVLERVSKDLSFVHGEFKELSRLAAEDGNAVTVAYADEQSGKLEKELWMLRASLG